MKFRVSSSIALFGAICFSVMFLTVQVHAQTGTPEHVNVYLLGGQSNMLGFVGPGMSGADLPDSLRNPQDDVLFYTRSDGLSTLRPGSGVTSNGGNDFGPEISFGRTIADASPGKTFGLIKYAAGATSLYNNWRPDGGGTYNTFRNTVDNGLDALTNAGHTFTISGMLWAQGEADANRAPDTEDYEDNLNEFIGDIRTRYGADLPFYFNRLSDGQTATNDAGYELVRAAQERVAANDLNAHLIDADGLSFHDRLHFDVDGQVGLGQAFGAAVITNSVPEPSAASLLVLGSLYLLRRRR